LMRRPESELRLPTEEQEPHEWGAFFCLPTSLGQWIKRFVGFQVENLWTLSLGDPLTDTFN
jgi:hypothetical protein